MENLLVVETVVWRDAVMDIAKDESTAAAMEPYLDGELVEWTGDQVADWKVHWSVSLSAE
jgi:hypothetical protein